MRRQLLPFVATALSVALQAQCPADNRTTTKPADIHAVGEQAHRSGNHEEAVRFFSDAIKVESASLNAFLHRAFSQYFLKRNDEVTTDLTVVVDQEPTKNLAYITRGRSYLKAGRPGLVLADLKKVVSLDPGMRSLGTTSGGPAGRPATSLLPARPSARTSAWAMAMPRSS